MTIWSDDQDLWDAMAPALSAPARYETARVDVASIVEATALPPGAMVLDVGCGAGTHAVAFAAAGFRVTAIDRNPTLLRLAANRASSVGVSVETLREDMREFIRPNHYDLVCSLNSSFAYFDDVMNARILRNMRTSLRSGGLLLLDTLGEGITSSGATGPIEMEGTTYSARRAFDATRHVVLEDWTVSRAGATRRYRTEQRIYGETEIRAILRTIGLVDIAVAASIDGATPYDESSSRLVASGRAV